MKKLVTISILAAMVAAGSVIKAQDRPPEYLGLPGDNLNLYAVMKLFQDSKTLEDFEKDLNDKKTGINNLDLNGDRKVDYITVTDNVNGNVHNIVLQDALSKDDIQDVAVFTVERFDNGGVQIQLTGDEDLYGKNYIIEPNYDEQGTVTPNPGYTGDNTVVYGRNVTIVRTTPVYIADWPLIRFIFRPGYMAWHSRWYWGYYPRYWYSWEPYYWDYYYGFHYNWYNTYYVHYRLCNYHRYGHWDDIYYHRDRHYSRFVNERIHSGYYKETYSHPEKRADGEQAYNKTPRESDRRSGVSNQRNDVRRTETRQSVERRSDVSNSNTGNRSNVNTNTNRSSNSSERRSSGTKEVKSTEKKKSESGSNTSTRRSSGTKEIKSDDKKKTESGSKGRREPLVMGSSRSSSGMNNRYAYSQRSTQSSVSGNRTGSGFNMRSSSGQTRGSGNISGRSGQSKSTPSVSRNSSSKSRTVSSSKSEKSNNSSHRR